MINNVRLKQNLINIPGWRTKRKIIVIESDDWGSIRMPSKRIFNTMLKHNIRVDKSPFCKYDRLEGNDDLASLFEVLNRFKDRNNNHPIITSNTVVGNPNFEKIKETNYNNYFWETFNQTYSRYNNCNNSFSLIKEGMRNGLWHPQFHGREHVNVNLWLSLLQSKDMIFLKAFENQMWGLSTDVLKMKRSIQATFDFENKNDLTFHKESIISGLKLFQELFGYRSISFIANNFIWSDEINTVLRDSGVDIFQGMKYQKLPIGQDPKREMRRHFLGEKNHLGQIYLIRNCKFEPSLELNSTDSVGSCLKDISNAFFWKKPAIITSHRLNFIGSLEEKNRIENINKFEELLKIILNKWPKVEFMSSTELGNIILKNKN